MKPSPPHTAISRLSPKTHGWTSSSPRIILNSANSWRSGTRGRLLIFICRYVLIRARICIRLRPGYRVSKAGWRFCAIWIIQTKSWRVRGRLFRG